MSDFVDRGSPMDGLNKTVRDSRLPYSSARAVTNYTMPDGRLRRRKGKRPYASTFNRSQLSKTGEFEFFSGGLGEAFDSSTDGRVRANGITSSPLSYGLLKHHDDFQPRSTRDWTTEFLLTLGDDGPSLNMQRLRNSKNDWPSFQLALRAAEIDGTHSGAFVYDQSVIANDLKIDYSTGSVQQVSPVDPINKSDTFALSALAVSYSKDHLKVSFNLAYTSSGEVIYFPVLLRKSNYGFNPGRQIHLAVRYDSSTRILDVLVDGEPFAGNSRTLASNQFFAGEVDSVNQQANGSGYVDDPIPRDIVLLNEFTVRGGMASTCKITQYDTVNQNATGAAECIFGYDAPGNYVYEPNTINVSPPPRTGMTELRYWHSLRTDQEISDNARRRIEAYDANLKGYWRLNDGSSVCVESVLGGTPRAPRLVTVHHGDPGYVADEGLEGGYGLSIADGQHLKLEYPYDFENSGDSRATLSAVFRSGNAQGYTQPKHYSSEHDFTVRMQIRTPNTFGKELNARFGDDGLGCMFSNNSLGTPNLQETSRQVPGLGTEGFLSQRLVDGTFMDNLDTPANKNIKTPATAGTQFPTYNRAFDQTLWSIEGDATEEDPASTFSGQTLPGELRFPLARGLLTPEGRVAFEFNGFDNAYTSSGTAQASNQYRIVSDSDTPLEPNTVYDLIFRKRAIAKKNSTLVDNGEVYYAFRLEIIISAADRPLPASGDIFDNYIQLGGLDIGDWTVPAVWPPAPNTSTISSAAMRYRGIRDVNIGASYQSDPTERGMGMEQYDSVSLPLFPRPTQRYITPYQDQPGYFTLGVFQMWPRALTDTEIRSVVAGRDAPGQELFNIMIDRPMGDQIVSRGATNDLFELRHKSWGSIDSHQNDHDPTSGTADQSARVIGTWAQRDRLGYLPVSDLFVDDGASQCHGLVPFASTLGRKFGILSFFDGSAYFDETLNGAFSSVPMGTVGMMNDYATNGRWRGAVIGDRAILTSAAGRPKRWDGKVMTTAGFQRWDGGAPIVEALKYNTGTSEIAPEKWYGFRLVYRAENDAIVDISPQVALKTPASVAPDYVYFRFKEIMPHPDPRVTSIQVYMTASDTPTTTREDAIASVDLKPFFQRWKNTYHPQRDVFLNPVGQVLDTLITTMPVCQFGASAFGRLYLSGDLNVPDLIYYTDAGNPERINTALNRIVLEEGSGDEIVGLASQFGALFAFKPGSIWRISDTGQIVAGVAIHDQVKVASIGPTSSDAMTTITEPETGRVSFVFWSKHGPYRFDGVNVAPIGFPIEGPEAFDDVVEGSVLIVHDVQHREIAFLYRSKSGCCDGCETAVRDRAFVFNYRTNTWTEETGVLGNVALSADLTVDISSRLNSGSFGVGIPTQATDTRYLPLVGTDHGRIVLWGQGSYDGIDGEFGDRATIATWDGDTNTATVTFPPDSAKWDTNQLRGLWVTFRKSDRSEWFQAQVLSNDDGSLEIDPRSCTLPFTPEAGDTIFVARPPAEIEFPWDVMDQAFYEKQLHGMVIWGSGEFLFRHAYDWVKDNTTAWNVIPASGQEDPVGEGQSRQKLSLRGNSEAFKIWLASFDLESEINAYGFEVEYRRDGNKNQDAVS